MRTPRRRDTRVLEKTIQRNLVEYAARYEDDLEVRKYSQGSRRFKTGDPDLIFWPRRPLVPFLIEVKREGEEPTEKQALKIKRYRELGYHVFVVDNAVDGRKIIDHEMQGGWKPLKAKVAR